MTFLIRETKKYIFNILVNGCNLQLHYRVNDLNLEHDQIESFRAVLWIGSTDSLKRSDSNLSSQIRHLYLPLICSLDELTSVEQVCRLKFQSVCHTKQSYDFRKPVMWFYHVMVIFCPIWGLISSFTIHYQCMDRRSSSSEFLLLCSM